MPTQHQESEVNKPDYNSRSGESNVKEFPRSGRFFCTRGLWFFKTREGLDYGPYNSRTECKYAYNEFIEVVSTLSDISSEPTNFEEGETHWKMPKINFS
ncbi:DUF6316 family protein [Aliikangiella sp. IMCC44653]